MSIKYNTIGEHYNRTRKADPFLTDQLITFLSPKKEGLYLDIGCGTGNYTNEFQKRGYNFIGIDPSKTMLDKAKKQNSLIDWSIGTAEDTGLSSNSVDGIVATLTIHHWTNLKLGFQELRRVLKPGGKLILFTSTPSQMKQYWLNHYFPIMLLDSIKQMPSMASIQNGLLASSLEFIKFDPYFIHKDLKDQFLYCGKHHPELYFDTHIRHGISSFSSLSNKEEVEKGLAQMRLDIDNGSIQNIMNTYQNNLGDYLFVTASK